MGPRRVHGPAVVLTMALLAAGCSDGSSGGGEPIAAPGFEAGDCWWDYPVDTTPDDLTITCGTVEVPSLPGDASSEPVRLSVARFHHAQAPKDEPPVLFLHGGPGGAALKSGPEEVMAMPTLRERDVILWDQRGTGDSTPSLNCPEKEDAIVEALARADPWEAELAANQEAVRACYARLTGAGIDLDQYDTLASVADIELLRETFDVEQWNLWGESYGTRLALAYAREHPERVRSLVLDSVYPPEVGGAERAEALVDGALHRLFDACAAQPACAEAYPDLEGLLATAVADLDRRPEQITRNLLIGDEAKDLTFTITGSDVRAGVFVAMYRSDLIPALPSIIAALAHGNRSIIPAFVDTGVPNLIEPSEGDLLSVECADSGRLVEGAQAQLQEITADALVALASAQVFCPDWPVEHAPESFNEQVVVDVPTLVFAGTLDPITPYLESKAQAEAMPDARYVEVPNGGHTVSDFDDCTKQAQADFWADPSSDPPACVADLAPLAFAVS